MLTGQKLSINPSTTSAACGRRRCQKPPCQCLWSRGRFFWHSCSASKSVALCSQVSSLCRASLWNNSFTLAAAQYGHNQSCHQPAVQTQAEELYSYENHRDSFRPPVLNAQQSAEQMLRNFSYPAQYSKCRFRQIAADTV